MATIPTGRFVWFEYVSKNPDRAQAFFGELFHWKTKPVPTSQGTYTMIALGSDTIGGYTEPLPSGPQQPHWLPHLQVANARDVASKVKAQGGKIVKEATSISDMGTMAVVTDPFGAAFAVWQPTKPETEANDYKGVDGAWIWNELYTQDPDKSVAFYKAIGGFEVEVMKNEGSGPGPKRYDMLKADGKGRAGIMKLADVPQMWMPYVKVADVDATFERAKKLGATFKMPPETMEGIGRMGVLIDPLGVPIGIIKPAPM